MLVGAIAYECVSASVASTSGILCGGAAAASCAAFRQTASNPRLFSLFRRVLRRCAVVADDVAAAAASE